MGVFIVYEGEIEVLEFVIGLLRGFGDYAGREEIDVFLGECLYSFSVLA